METSFIPHSFVFRRRRALNWIVLGLTYSAMYMGRYNLSMVNPLLTETYGWDKTQIGSIISCGLFAYGIFAMLNGYISDRVGGRKSLLVGAAGAVFCNFLFGLGGSLHFLGRGAYLLAFFSAIWMVNSYFQSFGAVSMIKVNAAWFYRQERGIFSAVFGSMLQLGRTAIFLGCPILLLTLSWQWLFFIPAIVILVMLFLAAWLVKELPSKCGFQDLAFRQSSFNQNEPVHFKWMIEKIFKNPLTLSIAAAEFCTGVVRQGFEQWFPRYLVEVQRLPYDSSLFQKNAIAVIVSGIAGFVVSGTLSDWVFHGRRIPVVCLAFAIQIYSLYVIWTAPSIGWITFAFMAQSFSTSMIHSMLSGTAPVDFGGQKAAATAAGFFDGMQYIGGSLVGVGMGWMLDRFGWSCWGPCMIGFSVMGGLLMTFFWNAKSVE